MSSFMTIILQNQKKFRLSHFSNSIPHPIMITQIHRWWQLSEHGSREVAHAAILLRWCIKDCKVLDFGVMKCLFETGHFFKGYS